jgi:hypothetical protein
VKHVESTATLKGGGHSVAVGNFREEGTGGSRVRLFRDSGASY